MSSTSRSSLLAALLLLVAVLMGCGRPSSDHLVGALAPVTSLSISGDTNCTGNTAHCATTTTGLFGVAIPAIDAGASGALTVSDGGLSWAASSFTDGGVPIVSGTGFAHVTSGTFDGTARAVNLGSADVTGSLGYTPATSGNWSTVPSTMSGGLDQVASLGFALSHTAHGVIVGNGTGLVGVTAAGGSGVPLLGAGASSDPAFGAVNLAGGSTIVTGLLPISNVAQGTAAQVLVTNSGASAPAWVSISGDSTVTAAGVMTNAGLKGTVVPTLASGYLQYTGSALAWSTPPGIVPTGTGFTHITSGAQDSAARAVNVSTADITGTEGVGNGGTGVATLTAHGLVCGEGTSAVATVGPGSGGQVLVSQGGTTDPAFESMSQDAVITSSGVLTVEGLEAKVLPSLSSSTQALQYTGSAWSFGRLPVSAMAGIFGALTTVSVGATPTLSQATVQRVEIPTQSTASGATMPGSPNDGDAVLVKTTGTSVAVQAAVTPNSGQSIEDPLHPGNVGTSTVSMGPNAGAAAIFIFESSGTTWRVWL